MMKSLIVNSVLALLFVLASCAKDELPIAAEPQQPEESYPEGCVPMNLEMLSGDILTRATVENWNLDFYYLLIDQEGEDYDYAFQIKREAYIGRRNNNGDWVITDIATDSYKDQFYSLGDDEKLIWTDFQLYDLKISGDKVVASTTPRTEPLFFYGLDKDYYDDVAAYYDNQNNGDGLLPKPNVSENSTKLNYQIVKWDAHNDDIFTVKTVDGKQKIALTDKTYYVTFDTTERGAYGNDLLYGTGDQESIHVINIGEYNAPRYVYALAPEAYHQFAMVDAAVYLQDDLENIYYYPWKERLHEDGADVNESVFKSLNITFEGLSQNAGFNFATEEVVSDPSAVASTSLNLDLADGNALFSYGHSIDFPRILVNKNATLPTIKGTVKATMFDFEINADQTYDILTERISRTYVKDFDFPEIVYGKRFEVSLRLGAE